MAGIEHIGNSWQSLVEASYTKNTSKLDAIDAYLGNNLIWMLPILFIGAGLLDDIHFNQIPVGPHMIQNEILNSLVPKAVYGFAIGGVVKIIEHRSQVKKK